MSTDLEDDIFSLALPYGKSLLEWRDGPTRSISGPEAARASRSRSPAKAPEKMIQGICGRTFFGSSASVDPPLWSENKSPTPQERSAESMKTCSTCGERKTFAEFYKATGSHASLTGYHASCKDCSRAWATKYRNGSKTRRSATHKKYREKNRAKVLIALAKHRAKLASLVFDLNEYEDKIQARIDKGICEASGMLFRLDGGRTWDSPSLDRIDPKLGYTISNVRVVLYVLNVMMNTWGAEKILEIADAMKVKRAQLAEHPLAKWEARLKERLANLGSTESELIWSQSVTPSGHLISRLVPSTRRTSETGSIGSPWPTPMMTDYLERGYMVSHGREYLCLPGAMDPSRMGPIARSQWPTPNTPSGGRTMTQEEAITQRKRTDGSKAQLNLENAMAHLAQSQWATPTQRDWRSGEASEATMERNARPLNERMAHFGPAPNGSGAPMAKRGERLVPNPNFAMWIMGFPEDLRNTILQTCSSLPSKAGARRGGSPATPSSRRSRPKSSKRFWRLSDEDCF